MTTPQSGREAFEALVEKWRIGKSVLVNGVGPAYREALAKCADELEAALAQQGREVGEAAEWQVRFIIPAGKKWSAWERYPSREEAEIAIFEWEQEGIVAELRPLYTAAPKQQAVEVTEDAVFRLACWMAQNEGHDDPHHLIWEGSPPEPWGEVWNRYEDPARSALLAALPGKTEVDRA